MNTTSLRRPAVALLPLVTVALVGALAQPAGAATSSTFHRYEVIADSRFVTSQECPAGSTELTSQTTVAITAGHEDESQDGTITLDNDYLRFGIQSVDCDGNRVTDSAFSQPGDVITFTSTPSLSSVLSQK